MEDCRKTREELLAEVAELRRELASCSFLALPGGNVRQQPAPFPQEWRELFDALGSAIWVMDRQCRITVANKACASLFKLSVAEMVGRPCWQVAHQGATAPIAHCPVTRAARSHQREVLEIEKDGRWLECVVDVLLDPSQEIVGYIHIVNDLTEHITSERRARNDAEDHRRQLAELNTLLNLVINTIPMRIFWKNRDSLYLGGNRSLAVDLGKSGPQELVGMSDFALLGAPRAEQSVEEDRQVMATGEPIIDDEKPWDLPSGKRAWLRTTKVPLRHQSREIFGVLGIYEDITDKKAMEEQLRESEERYRGFFQNNHAVMLVIDPGTGKIIDANPAACRYYGWPLSTLREKLIMDINMLSGEEVSQEMARAKVEERNYFLFSHRLASGEVRPVEVYSGPIFKKDKQLLYSIIHDIGERKKAENDRERLIGELREALAQIKTLSGMLPICSSCKKIRDDQGYWNQIESYIRSHSQAEFTHSICPECATKLCPELFDDEE